MQRRPTRSATTAVFRVATAVALALLATVRPAAAQLPAPPVYADGPLQIGGYASVTMDKLDRPEAVEGYEVSELSAALLGWGQLTTRTSYFVELDMAKRTAETWTGRETDQWIVPERLYMEYAAARAARVRLGRFLTPIGQWNEEHAEPLTWTPTRPLSTYSPFAKSMTGVLVAGDGTLGGRDVGYAAFWAPSLDLDRDLESDEESSFASALGIRVAAILRPGLTVGASAARVRRSTPVVGSGPEDEGGRALFGGDVRWVTSSVELQLEGTWLAAAEERPYEGGAFALAAVRLWGPLWAVARGETYRPVEDATARVGFAGLTLRASPHFVAKVGHQFSGDPSTRIPDGWFASFSSLF